MSLPDYLLDPNWDEVCISCGERLWPGNVGMCRNCKSDNHDMYADDKISEGKRHAKI